MELGTSCFAVQETTKKSALVFHSNDFMAMRKNTKGFTLLEMLIVVAVVAVLAAVAIPAISKSVHRSQEMADVANVRAYYAFLQADYMSTGK